MALSIYTKTCAKNIAGSNAVLVTEASNIGSVTVDASGEVTAIGMTGAATFKQIQADQDSILRTEEAAGSESNLSYTHSIQMGFAKGSVDLNTLRDSLADASACGIVAVVQDSNGKSWLVGYNEVDKAKRALRLTQDNYGSGNSPADEDVQKADVILSSISGYVDLPLDSDLNDNITAALASGGGTAIEWSPGAAYGTEYQAIYDAMTSKPSSSVATAQDTLVEAMKTAGVWSILDVFYMFAQENNGDSEALINWKNPGTLDASLVNTPAWVSLEGFTGNGVDNGILTNYSPTTDGVNYLQNDACAGLYVRTNVAEDVDDIGTSTSGIGDLGIQARRASDNAAWIINDDTNDNQSNSDSRGMFIAVRTGSALKYLYKNGAELSSGTTASTGVPTQDIVTHGQSTARSTKQISAVFAGGGLTPTQVADFTTAFEAYMDSNSKGVIA